MYQSDDVASTLTTPTPKAIAMEKYVLYFGYYNMLYSPPIEIKKEYGRQSAGFVMQ